jgi:hypothetical protein
VNFYQATLSMKSSVGGVSQRDKSDHAPRTKRPYSSDHRSDSARLVVRRFIIHHLSKNDLLLLPSPQKKEQLAEELVSELLLLLSWSPS